MDEIMPSNPIPETPMVSELQSLKGREEHKRREEQEARRRKRKPAASSGDREPEEPDGSTGEQPENGNRGKNIDIQV